MAIRSFDTASTARGPIPALIVRHPLAAFITLAYAISWLAWLLMRLVDTGSFNGLFALGATGPALAAMIVSAVVLAEPSDAPAGRRWFVFGLALAVGMATLVLSRLYAASVV
ncbi:MAG TPA: hypothetical protein VFU22_01620 [Roseiflexaceae bacterium]|nr:hypothetical protein [Roseiflexaceae bacterium]